jgi:hypothetical protein
MRTSPPGQDVPSTRDTDKRAHPPDVARSPARHIRRMQTTPGTHLGVPIDTKTHDRTFQSTGPRQTGNTETFRWTVDCERGDCIYFPAKSKAPKTVENRDPKARPR